MRVLFVTSEAYPLAKSGGLADVSGALPNALVCRGADVCLLLPGYESALEELEGPRVVARLEPMLGVTGARLISGLLPNTAVPVLIVDAPSLFRRKGGLYQRDDGQDWPDNAVRFAYLSHVGAELAMGRTAIDWEPDIIHANDWHTGLLPFLLSLEESTRPSTLFTLHNMAFQGNFSFDVLEAIGLSADRCADSDLEFNGQVSFLKAGLRHADRITTVSPTYANEILTPEFGFGLEGLLRTRNSHLTGILNGIDDTSWDPTTDIHLPQTFSGKKISGKRVCKVALQREFGLPINPDIPLVGFSSRLAHQKMADVVLAVLPRLAEKGAQFVLVGEGDRGLEAEFVRAQEQNGDCVSVHIGYDEAVAHRLHAGCDILLAPARFEPCGLTQLYAIRYGTLPIVRQTGGLIDTVVDASPAAIADRTATGFVFGEPSEVGLITALDRALLLYKQPVTWRRMQLQAMAQDFSWNTSADRYLSLYSEISAMPPAAGAGDAADDETGEEDARIAI